MNGPAFLQPMMQLPHQHPLAWDGLLAFIATLGVPGFTLWCLLMLQTPGLLTLGIVFITMILPIFLWGLKASRLVRQHGQGLGAGPLLIGVSSLATAILFGSWILQQLAPAQGFTPSLLVSQWLILWISGLFGLALGRVIRLRQHQTKQLNLEEQT